MPKLDQRIAILRKERIPMIARAIKKLEDRPEIDNSGQGSSLLAIDHRFMAVADYFIDHDIDSFKRNMNEVAEIYNLMQRRFDRGQPIDGSYMTLTGADAVWAAMAAGNLDLTLAIAERMGGRPHLEEQGDHPFDLALGYAVKHIIQGNDEAARSRVDDLAVICRDPELADFVGYPFVLQALLDCDVHGLATAFADLLECHRHNCADRNGLFADREDEVLFVRGLGLANLCRWRGLAIDSGDVLIPSDLLVPVYAQFGLR